MRNFTYLIGAGASANTIPVIKDFGDNIENFVEEIKTELARLYLPTDKDQKFMIIKFTNQLLWLVKQINSHTSVDTFAKKLFLQKDLVNLTWVRFLLSEFLLYKEFTNPVDRRYETFFASILDIDSTGKLNIPPNISILSWNYDKQIEYAFQNFSLISLDEIDNTLQVFPGIEEESFTPDKFCIIKINGSNVGRISTDGQFRNIPMVNLNVKTDSNKHEYFQNLIRRIFTIEQEIKRILLKKNNRVNSPSILYSWDNNKTVESTRKKLYQVAEKTNFLIVIGYSFPTFNRIVDKQILRKMKNLNKIYVQDIAPDGVEQRLDSLLENKNIEIKKMKETSEFYIPFEFS